MKNLIFILLFIVYNTTINSQVSLNLGAKNTEEFSINIYEIKYSTNNDSIKIKEYKPVSLSINIVDNFYYSLILPKNSWYLIEFNNEKNQSKKLFFQTDTLVVKTPITFIADFSNSKSYYMQYDSELKNYSGGELNIP